MGPLDWSWPEVVEASKPDVTVDIGAGLGGPKREEEPLWPGCPPCGGWRTGDPHVAPLLPCPWSKTPWTWPGGRLSLPPGKNAAASGSPDGPAGPQRALC